MPSFLSNVCSILQEAANWRDGKNYAPARLPVLDLAKVKLLPSHLTARRVYALKIPKFKTPPIKFYGKKYITLADEAQKCGLKVFRNERGLRLIGKNEISFSEAKHEILF